MRFNKNYKRGLFLLFLLLLLTTSISFFTFDPKNNNINQNSIFLSAPEDNYEPNNDPSSATDIRFNEANWLGVINGNGTLWDDDWYLIDLDPGEERLKVDLIFNHAAGNIDIEVYDGTLSYITGNYSMDDNEFLEVDIFPSGIYYLRIFGANAGNTYDFYWEDLMPHDDPFEENDDFWNSKWVNPNWYSDLRIINYDEDWFHLYLNPGDTIDVSIYFSHMDGDLELELYDPTYSHRTGDYSIDDNEYITYTIDMSGDWRIRVYRVSGVIDVHYDLDIGLSTGDDWMEENDDYWSSVWVDPNYYSGLKIVGYDEDWYHTYLTPDDIINVFIYFDNNLGNLELELYDPSHSHRNGSYSINNEESFSFTIDVSGDWRIRVYQVLGSEDVHYDLDIWLDMGGHGDDSFEENDGFWSSARIDPNWYSDLRILGDDEDWFHLYLNTGDIIDVAIHFYHEEGDLQLELYDPSYTHRDGSYSSTENYDWSKEHIMYRADMSGDWRIRVYHETGDSDVHYELDIKIVDDFYEFNNNWDEAYRLKDDEYTWLSDISGLAVQGDEDWYLIDVSRGFEHLIVNLKFNLSEGDIYINIYQLLDEDEYNLDWNPILLNNSMSGDDSIDIDSLLPWGVYFIKIHGYDIKMEYDLWWDDIRTDFRPDDDYEENDDPLTAYDMSDYQNTHLWDISEQALQYDNDWYKILVYSGREHLFVEVLYDYQEGHIGIKIYDWDFSEITSNLTERDNEFIHYDLPSNGTYYIKIFGDHSGNVYSLMWDTWEPYIEEMIPGYDILILLSAIFGVATIITIKYNRSKFKHK